MNIEQVAELARQASKARRWAEAHVLHESATRLAEAAGWWDDAAVYGINALGAAVHARRTAAAFKLIFQLREITKKVENYSSTNARHYLLEILHTEFDLLLTYRPSLPSLVDRIAEFSRLLELVEPENAVRAIDLQAHLARERGELANRRHLVEDVWRLVESGSGLRNHRHNIIGRCLHAALACDDQEAAEDWLRLLRAEGEIDCPGYRLDLADAEAELFRRKRDIAGWRKAAERLFTQSEQLNWPVWVTTSAWGLARALLIETPEIDPLAPDHPARRFMRHRYGTPMSLTERYDNMLFILDVRLASVRWALGVQAVDDDSETDRLLAPIRVTENRAPAKAVQGRIWKALGSLRRARQAAQVLDVAFECEFRRRDVDGRAMALQRLELL